MPALQQPVGELKLLAKFDGHSDVVREAAFLSDRVLVMSARPGRIIAERFVDLPRPRRLEMTYDPYSVALVHELREHISSARARAA